MYWSQDWALAFAKSTALWKQCAQADWALSLLTPTTELWLPKLGIRRYHQSKPEFWTPPELSDTRMVISVNLSFGNTASLWIQGGLGHPSPSPVKKRISRSSQRRNRIRKEAFFSWKKASPCPSAPSSAMSGSFFLWGLRMSTPLEFSMKKPNTQRQESTTRARECRCQFGQVLQFNSMKS